MKQQRAQWGIGQRHGDMLTEWEVLDRARGGAEIVAPDHDQTRTPVLYGPRGETLIERRPRPVGFRPR